MSIPELTIFQIMKSLLWGNECGIFKNLLKIVNEIHKITPCCVCVAINKNKIVFVLEILATQKRKEQCKYTDLNLDIIFSNVQSASFYRLFNSYSCGLS